ncbi:MAG: sigma factor-like helix-turn-helix DNA-binding protein, partial [Planctomycetota bacterium]
KEKPLPAGTSVVFQPIAARDPSPSAVVSGSEREAAVRLAITTLEPLDQRIVMMRVYQELEFAAIGSEVGMKEDSVRVRCNRALVKVSRKVLAMQHGDVDGFLA